MNKEQNKLADKAIERLNEIRAKIAANGDSDELTKEYNDIVMDIQSGLYDVLTDMKKNGVKKYWEQNNDVDIREFPVCGVLQDQPDFDAVDEQIGAGEVDNITNEIKDNPIEFDDLKEIAADAKPGFGGKEMEAFRIMPLDIGAPKWITQLKSDLLLFKQRRKTKAYYDPESLVRGVPAKQKEKKVLRAKTLWILLDVSGSMLTAKTKGKRVIDLVASFIPPIANKFQGELWQVDTGVPKNPIRLKDLTKAKVQGIPIRGGRGTEFSETFRAIDKKKKELQDIYGEKTDFMTILLTDAIVNWNFKLPNNLIIVTLSDTKHRLPYLDPKKNQKAIIVQVDPK